MPSRIALIALAAVIGLAIGSAQASSPAGVGPPAPGDFTCDQQVNGADSLALVKYLGNLDPGVPASCPGLGSITRAANGMIAFEHNGEIYTMDAAGGNQTNITNDPSYDWYPMWSHDGKHLAFSSDRDGPHDHLFIVDPDGGNIMQLTHGNGDDESSSWSPDGQKLVFDSYNGNDNDIYVIGADGNGRQNIPSGSSFDDFYPAWSPDGKHIVFTSDRGGGIGDLYTMDPDGSHIKPLLLDSHYKANPFWSPDSSKVAFSVSNGSNSDIYVVSASGGTPANLTNNPYRNYDPGWSPDGLFILFDSSRDDPSPSTCDPCKYEIYRMNANGSQQTKLTDLTTVNENAVWQPIPSFFGDLNCDGLVDLQDLIASLRYGASLLTQLPPGCPAIGP